MKAGELNELAVGCRYKSPSKTWETRLVWDVDYLDKNPKVSFSSHMTLKQCGKVNHNMVISEFNRASRRARKELKVKNTHWTARGEES